MILPQGLTEGPPSDFALKKRKWAALLVILQFALTIAKFACLDLIGGFCLLMIAGVGYFVAFGSPPMQARWVIMWGFICAVNAVFDTVLATLRMVELYHLLHGNPLSPHPASASAKGADSGPREQPPRDAATALGHGWIVFFASTIVLVPIVEAISAWLCWRLHKEATEHMDERGGDGLLGGGGYGSVYGGGDGGGLGLPHPEAGARPMPSGPQFQPFQGSGNRLTD